MESDTRGSGGIEPDYRDSVECIPDVVVFKCGRSRLAIVYPLLLAGVFAGYLLSLKLQLPWFLSLLALLVIGTCHELCRRQPCLAFVYRDERWWLRGARGKRDKEMLFAVELEGWQRMPWLLVIRFVANDGECYVVRAWRDSLDARHWLLLPSLLSL